ncbi:Acylphosphatase [Coniella lustricola]|uniref:acylphosphatase n=1 Tax=Coniella lustricola TaxID=2025994 RepID=A0A2T2ZU68_9PEZI|nr:Acylphosphatase [Coniella lustricola]
MAQAQKRIHYVVEGGVQGVGYRYFTRKHATARDLTGWVRNTQDEKVEGEAQGEKNKITDFLKELNKGPSHATVSKVNHEQRDVVEGEAAFEVRN